MTRQSVIFNKEDTIFQIRHRVPIILWCTDSPVDPLIDLLKPCKDQLGPPTTLFDTPSGRGLRGIRSTVMYRPLEVWTPGVLCYCQG